MRKQKCEEGAKRTVVVMLEVSMFVNEIKMVLENTTIRKYIIE